MENNPEVGVGRRGGGRGVGGWISFFVRPVILVSKKIQTKKDTRFDKDSFCVIIFLSKRAFYSLLRFSSSFYTLGSQILCLDLFVYNLPSNGRSVHILSLDQRLVRLAVVTFIMSNNTRLPYSAGKANKPNTSKCRSCHIIHFLT